MYGTEHKGCTKAPTTGGSCWHMKSVHDGAGALRCLMAIVHRTPHDQYPPQDVSTKALALDPSINTFSNFVRAPMLLRCSR